MKTRHAYGRSQHAVAKLYPLHPYIRVANWVLFLRNFYSNNTYEVNILSTFYYIQRPINDNVSICLLFHSKYLQWIFGKTEIYHKIVSKCWLSCWPNLFWLKATSTGKDFLCYLHSFVFEFERILWMLQKIIAMNTYGDDYETKAIKISI